MHPWLEAGIPIITWLQSLGDWLIAPMKFFTFLGEAEFFLILIPAILWCFDVGLGLRIGIIYLSSSAINAVLKLAFGLPRPYWVSSKVRAFKAANGFGLPSGHAQSALAVWGTLAVWLRRRWTTLALIVLIFMISISRLFLAVHFPLDTLVGWFAGALILVGVVKLEEPLIRWIRGLRVIEQVGVVFGGSLLILAMGLTAYFASAGRSVPTAWVAAAQAAIPDAERINPRNLDDFFATAGTFFGVGLGGALLYSWGRFKADGAWGKRAGRYLLGTIGVLALYYGLKLVFPGGETPLALILRYVRYAVVGCFASYLGPRLFVAVRLA